MLYSTTGKPKTWNAWIIEGGVMVEQGTIEQGKEGKLVQSVVLSSNPEKELMSLRQKKIKQGYVENNPFSFSNTNIEMPSAMLAQEWTKTPIKFPVYLQPKLDGIRCLVYKNGGKLVFQSRSGLIFQSFPHLEEMLLPVFREGMILDGELYNHELEFPEISGMVRKLHHPDLSRVQYHVYDLIQPGTFEERLDTLRTIGLEMDNIFLTETIEAHSMDEIEDYHTNCVERGYEGIMIRTPGGKYKQNRSKDLLKYKHFKTEEFKVVGHTVGKHDIPVFECETNGKTFGVMMKSTRDSKQEMLTHVEDYYGKWLTVKYQELSQDGIPRFPVGIDFRMVHEKETKTNTLPVAKLRDGKVRVSLPDFV